MMPAKRAAYLVMLVATGMTASVLAESGVHWPSFRGARAAGLAEGFSTPTKWNGETGENIQWKTRIPGLAHSGPVIWGNRLFVTSAVAVVEGGEGELKVGLYGNIAPVNDDTAHTWTVYCLDKRTGDMIWSQDAHTGVPKIKRHTKATHANCTPATNGRYVVAFFGSEGLYCYDVAGKLIWKKDLGLLDSGYYAMPGAQWGFAGSPIIHENRVIVQCDIQKDSFIAAFDIKDGREVWRTPRDEFPTWSTPTIHESPGRTQVVVNGFKHIGGYDAKTGRELWRLRGGGDIPVPTPVAAHGLLFITNAHGAMAPLYAIRPNAEQDITLKRSRKKKYLAWSVERNGAYMQTPIVVGDYLYSCSDGGVLKCYEAKTGRVVYKKRLGGGRSGFTASPVAADGELYFTSEDGDVYVLQAGPEYVLLATNPMGEICMATPAISEGVLYFRAHRNMIAIGSEKAKSPAADK